MAHKFQIAVKRIQPVAADDRVRIAIGWQQERIARGQIGHAMARVVHEHVGRVGRHAAPKPPGLRLRLRAEHLRDLAERAIKQQEDILLPIAQGADQILSHRLGVVVGVVNGHSLAVVAVADDNRDRGGVVAKHLRFLRVGGGRQKRGHSRCKTDTQGSNLLENSGHGWVLQSQTSLGAGGR